MTIRGLDSDGTIAREGALSRVPEVFQPVVDAARNRITDAFDSVRLNSAYLYGSIPRGTATPGVSDLDLMVVLHAEPTDTDRAHVKTIEAVLAGSFSQINGVGILLSSANTLLSELERYDGGFFIACLCTPILGADLARQLPRYRPTSLLARETNGDLGLVLPQWRATWAESTSENQRRTLIRVVGRRIVRTGFTLVMPRWNGWTSDLDESSAAFGAHYPEHASQMRVAAQAGRTASADTATMCMLLEDLGPWLAAEYTALHGEKTPRT